MRERAPRVTGCTILANARAEDDCGIVIWGFFVGKHMRQMMRDFIFTADDDLPIDQLVEEIGRVREGSPLLFDVQQLTMRDTPDVIDYRPMLDAFVAQYGYTGLGEHWIEVQRRVARKILFRVLLEELAYPEQTMSTEEAEAFAARFLDLFAAGSRYFTNGTCSGEVAIYTLTGDQVLGWRSISTATFDNGVIVVNGQRIGIIWAEDES